MIKYLQLNERFEDKHILLRTITSDKMFNCYTNKINNTKTYCYFYVSGNCLFKGRCHLFKGYVSFAKYIFIKNDKMQTK